jgi:membrane-bound lytic murein transglycosylase D
MLSDPERYNIKLNFTPTRPYFAGVTLPHNASFTQLAAASQTSLEELKILNPGYAKTAKIADKDYTFLIPADKTKQFAAASLPIPTIHDVADVSTSTAAKQTNTNKISYRIKSGDTLSKIAKQFNVSVSDLKKWNPVNANKTKLALGDLLYVYPGNKYSLQAR